MKNRLCYLFVFDGYSDWEPALAVAGLQQFTDFEVRTFSLDGKAVTSAANLTITPSLSLAELDTADLIVIPGGAAWSEGRNREITPFVKKALAEGKTVAAICDATLYLASEGFLDGIKHTSNDLGLLKEAVPGYKGEALYEPKPAVADGQVITANGTAGVSFAHEIFNHFGVLEQNEQFAFWFGFFHKPEFLALREV
ncbi:type 1 glutamine amidotransferase family protein [Chitinophaga sp. SYP-B3965]|uniref:type 1 glutamine amidotransferase family protein n=1 Tax=Chitinophaga sp. SYP-B3965 TaxID=2663120 RepID=UPI0015664F2D|nr:type 1 glutamine amidotransferase family protein [Chitinophaga sp. SYP-B3965]